MFEEKTVFDVKRELDAGDPGGLSDREAKQRLSIYGKNELQEKKPPSVDRKSTRLNSSHPLSSRMPSSA